MERPYVMSLAGLDPSAGAGLLADIKTFEAHQTYGLGVCTALTVQTDQEFLSVNWLPAERITEQAKPLLQKFAPAWCKIGIVADVPALLEIVRSLHQLRPGIRIILDPVLKASAGFDFHNAALAHAWQEVLPYLYLLTPNYDEALVLGNGAADGQEAAAQLSRHCAVLLKGGHHPENRGWDVLYTQESEYLLPPVVRQVYAKHGSGCVLSAAITAQLALGHSLPDACINGKAYTEKFLSSHPSLLGYHNL
ncbi:MAG TPA: hydroxymethylpyrimidine/phosphomethylpyrimidine kinase [Chitinophaga sp.]|uniref:hydroxymethylpyrimidine/phosphomethylpyrimidine kinase n=1 Tax=Chitinophaga sp. TaxID=1869181 RepID=UPI002F94A782